MSSETTDIGAETLRWLRDELGRRESEIITGMRQVPDYPPLPACPNCVAHPNQIQHADDLITFKPCGHQFQITEEAKLDVGL